MGVMRLLGGLCDPALDREGLESQGGPRAARLRLFSVAAGGAGHGPAQDRAGGALGQGCRDSGRGGGTHLRLFGAP